MSNSILISLIIITKNRSSQIEKNLDSIKKQSVLPHEIIIVDGSSKRNSVLSKMNNIKTIPIKYLYEPLKNIPQARNIGVQNSSGSVVLYIDDDCIMPPTTFEQIRKHFDNKNIDGIIGKAINNDKENIACCIQDAYYERWLWELFKNNPLTITKISKFIPGLDIAAFKKDMLLKYQFYEKTPFGIDEDIEISRRILQINVQIFFDPSLYVFHNRPNTLSSFYLRTIQTGYANAWNKALFSQDIHITPYVCSLLEFIAISEQSSNRLKFFQKIVFWTSWLFNPILYRIGYYSYRFFPQSSVGKKP